MDKAASNISDLHNSCRVTLVGVTQRAVRPNLGQPQAAAVAISLTLLMRARDILNGGLGLLLAGRVFGR